MIAEEAKDICGCGQTSRNVVDAGEQCLESLVGLEVGEVYKLVVKVEYRSEGFFFSSAIEGAASSSGSTVRSAGSSTTRG